MSLFIYRNGADTVKVSILFTYSVSVYGYKCVLCVIIPAADYCVCALLLSSTKESSMSGLLFWWSLWITSVCSDCVCHIANHASLFMQIGQ